MIHSLYYMIFSQALISPSGAKLCRGNINYPYFPQLMHNEIRDGINLGSIPLGFDHPNLEVYIPTKNEKTIF